MIELLDLQSKNTFGYRMDGGIEKSDMEMVFDSFEDKMGDGKKLSLYAEIKSIDLGEISAEAMKEELRRIYHHPEILVNVSKGALVTDIPWLRRAFEIESALVPTFTGKSFRFGEEALALEWLQTDQREASRLDITLGELTQTSTLKFAAGLGLGFLAASLFSKKQRQALGIGILAGTVLAGLPLGIKILNNNRQLFRD